MSNCCDNNQTPLPPQGNCDGIRAAGPQVCDDRLASLPRSRRIRLLGADGRCLREFPSESKGFIIYDGAGGAIVTDQPVVPLHYRKNYAKDPVSGAILLDGEGQPIETIPQGAHSFVASDSDGGIYRWQGQNGVAQRIRWDGYRFQMFDEVFDEKDYFCDLDVSDGANADEAVLVPYQTQQLVNGQCVETICYRLARRNPSLESIFNEYVEATNALIESLQNQLNSLNLASEGATSFFSSETYENVGIPWTNLLNRPSNWQEQYDNEGVATATGGQIRIDLPGEYLVNYQATVNPNGTGRTVLIRGRLNNANIAGAHGRAYVGAAVAAPSIGMNFSGRFATGDLISIGAAADGTPGAKIGQHTLTLTRVRA